VSIYVALLLGSGVGLGLYILIAGLRGEPVLPRSGQRASRRRGQFTTSHRGKIWLLAAFVGALVWLITGWFAAGLLAICAAIVLPRTFGGQSARKAWIAKTEAIATWTEMLRDTMAAADGVEEAIAATVPLAPKPIREQVALLDARRRSERPLTEALAVFGQEVDHPSADLVVAALSMAAEGEGSDFVSVLSRLSTITRDEVKMRLRVEAGRAQVRTASRMIVGILIVAVLVLSVMSRGYLEPYGTVAGQMWLVLVGGVFALGVVLMEYMSRIELPERFSPRRARVG
jgi:Flp pilus assembly protein TadB